MLACYCYSLSTLALILSAFLPSLLFSCRPSFLLFSSLLLFFPSFFLPSSCLSALFWLLSPTSLPISIPHTHAYTHRTCPALQRRYVHLWRGRAGMGHETHELPRPLPHVRTQVTHTHTRPDSLTVSPFLASSLLLSLFFLTWLAYLYYTPLPSLNFFLPPSLPSFCPPSLTRWLSFTLPYFLYWIHYLTISTSYFFFLKYFLSSFLVRTYCTYRIRSYRELPIRVADFGVLHRNELSGQYLRQVLLCCYVVHMTWLD